MTLMERLIMIYRYRNIQNAKREIENSTFYFASHEELNDPIEDYVRVYWQGDKAAWEGLLGQYICSLYFYFSIFFTHKDYYKRFLDYLNSYETPLFREEMTKLGHEFLSDDEINRIIEYYSDSERNLNVNEHELCFILRFIHHKALRMCLNKALNNVIIPPEVGVTLLEMLEALKNRHFPFDELKKFDSDNDNRDKVIKSVTDIISDNQLIEYLQLNIKNGSFAGNEKNDENSEYESSRYWTDIIINYPKKFIIDIKELLFPQSFVVCFSNSCTNSAMWGNYADNHQGVCLIYEPKNNEVMLYGKEKQTLKIKSVDYNNKPLKCNFFNSLIQLKQLQIELFLTGMDCVSTLYNNDSNISDNGKYQELAKMKSYCKTKDWETETESRIVLNTDIYKFMDRCDRVLKYDSSILTGIIFGINTTESDKQLLLSTLLNCSDINPDFKFYQSEYDDIKQCISIRELSGWADKFKLLRK